MTAPRVIPWHAAAAVVVAAMLLLLALTTVALYQIDREKGRSLAEDQRLISANQELACSIGAFLLVTRAERIATGTMSDNLRVAYAEIFRDLDQINCR